MPNEPTPSGAPAPRRDRREAARRERNLVAASTTAQRPAWQSPMVLLTVGAVAVGLVVILLASGVLTGSSGGSGGDLRSPVRPTPTDLVDPANNRALGVATAPVQVEVWSDFQCPGCGFFATTIGPDLVDQFVKDGTVHLTYRDMTFLDGGGPTGESQRAASAARCAGEQGSFWPYHDYLFENQDGENQGAFRRARLDEIAAAVGLDTAAFGTCLDGGSQQPAVEAETAAGAQAGIGSTPTIVINGVAQRPGALPMEDTASGPGLRSLIEAALAQGSPAPSGSPAPPAAPAP